MGPVDRRGVGSGLILGVDRADGRPDAKGSETAITMSPYYDFIHLLKHVIEQEKSFEPEKLKRALDNTKNYPGLLGKMSFSATDHTGIGPDEIAMGTLLSVKDPRSMGVFRERA